MRDALARGALRHRLAHLDAQQPVAHLALFNRDAIDGQAGHDDKAVAVPEFIAHLGHQGSGHWQRDLFGAHVLEAAASELADRGHQFVDHVGRCGNPLAV